MGHRHAPPVKHDDPGMRGPRSRDENGELRQKRGDTRVDTIEEQYDVDLGVRGDTRLDTLPDRTGATSLKDVIDRLKQ